MPLLPRKTVLGELHILEVFEFYDHPCLFTCQNATGQIYLAVWVHDGEDADTWLYVPISPNRHQYVRSGGIDLHDAFRLAEDGVVFRVSVPKGDNAAEVERIACTALQDQELPLVGEKLSEYTQTLPPANVSQLVERAEGGHREAIQIELDVPEDHRSEASATLLARVLSGVQDCLDSFGQARGGVPTSRGRISDDILRKTEMHVVQAKAASFCVELVASKQADMFGDSLVAKAINDFLELLKAGDDAPALRERLAELKSRSATRYRFLLSHLAAAGAGMKVDWASFEPSRRTNASMTKMQAERAVGIVGQIESSLMEPYDIEGEFYAINLKTRRFGFITLTEELYRGRFKEDVVSEGMQVIVKGQLYRVGIQEIHKLTDVTGVEKVEYLLMSLAKLEG